VPSFREALTGAVSNAFCATTDAVGGAAGLIGDSIDALPGGNAGLADALAGLENLASMACNRQPQQAPPPPPPFTGGQCPGVSYLVNFTSTVTNPSSPNFGQTVTEGSTHPGPIGGFANIFPSTGNPNFGSVVLSHGLDQFGNTTSEFQGRENASINFVSGSPDNCGDAAPVPPPYVPGDYTDNPTIDYDDDDGNPVTINPTLVVAPIFIDANAEVHVPVSIEFQDGSSLFGDVNLSTGDVEFNFGSGPGDCQEPKPTRDDDSVDGDDPGEEGDNFTDPIIGVLVKVTSVGSDAKITEIETELGVSNLFVPRLANVTFQCLVEDGGGRAWTERINVQYLTQLIECPISWGALNVSVVAEPGVSLTFTALRGKTTRQLVAEQAAT